jgi:hypothetical protein
MGDYIDLMTGFSKLWADIVHSTVWREDMHVKVVWVTMLAMSDRNGNVASSLPGLADAARVPLDLTVDALKRLSSPDPYSRTKEYEGRRIQEIEGGWHILNYVKFRNRRSQEERRIKVAEAVQRYRDRKKSDSITVITGKPIAEADAESRQQSSTKKGRSRSPFVRPTLGEVESHIKAKGYHFSATAFIAFYDSKGWTVGKQPMKDWHAACVTWEERYRSQGVANATPAPPKQQLCRSCKDPMSERDLMESAFECRACRMDHGV